jgi:hypothetical protein
MRTPQYNPKPPDRPTGLLEGFYCLGRCFSLYGFVYVLFELLENVITSLNFLLKAFSLPCCPGGCLDGARRLHLLM